MAPGHTVVDLSMSHQSHEPADREERHEQKPHGAGHIRGELLNQLDAHEQSHQHDDPQPRGRRRVENRFRCDDETEEGDYGHDVDKHHELHVGVRTTFADGNADWHADDGQQAFSEHQYNNGCQSRSLAKAIET
jgi:hypothetical protein